MPTIPVLKTFTNSSIQVLNGIRNSATQNYKNFVPKATANADSIREIGAIIMDNVTLQNEFTNSLVNRIGKVIVTSKSYQNSLRMFKKGMLEFGETIEEVFVELIKPFQYDPEVSATTMFKRELPDVRTAFHVTNFKKFYKVTIQEDDLKRAFLSMSGVVDLVVKITEKMYTSEQYDEFQVMKYMLGKHILKGQLYPVEISQVVKANMSDIAVEIKATSNDMEFMKRKFNLAGVRTHCMKADQYLLVNTRFDANMDVNVLATAFNMDKAQFMGHRVPVDSFGEIDTERLAELFLGDVTYTPFTPDELLALDSIPAVLLDKDWFMVFDRLFKIKEVENGEGLYWNYNYHVWKTFSVSPFASNALFIPGTPSVTSITLSPATATVSAGQSVVLKATVVVENFAQKVVNWTIDSELSTIDTAGNLTIGEDETAETITVTATSEYDNTVTGTAVITVA